MIKKYVNNNLKGELWNGTTINGDEIQKDENNTVISYNIRSPVKTIEFDVYTDKVIAYNLITNHLDVDGNSVEHYHHKRKYYINNKVRKSNIISPVYTDDSIDNKLIISFKRDIPFSLNFLFSDMEDRENRITNYKPDDLQCSMRISLVNPSNDELILCDCAGLEKINDKDQATQINTEKYGFDMVIYGYTDDKSSKQTVNMVKNITGFRLFNKTGVYGEFGIKNLVGEVIGEFNNSYFNTSFLSYDTVKIELSGILLTNVGVSFDE